MGWGDNQRARQTGEQLFKWAPWQLSPSVIKLIDWSVTYVRLELRQVRSAEVAVGQAAVVPRVQQPHAGNLHHEHGSAQHVPRSVRRHLHTTRRPHGKRMGWREDRHARLGLNSLTPEHYKFITLGLFLPLKTNL